jgi:hypothetical protein
MKRILVIIAIALGILMFTAPAAWARGGMQGDIASCRGGDCYECCHHGGGCRGGDCYDYRRAGCRGADCAGVRAYSPVTFETVSGEVIEVYQATSRQGYKSGLHLLVKANEETIDVHLGPISYIEGQNFNFEPGDALEIKGDLARGEARSDRFTDSPMPTMTAIEVKKGNDTLTLRDDDGFPMWRASLR